MAISTFKGTRDLYSWDNEAQTLLDTLKPDGNVAFVKAEVPEEYRWGNGLPMYVNLDFYGFDVNNQPIRVMTQQISLSTSADSSIRSAFGDSDTKERLASAISVVFGLAEDRLSSDAALLSLNILFSESARQKFGKDNVKSHVIERFYENT